MTTPEAQTERKPPTIPGRVFVPLFVAALLVAVTVAVVMTLRIRPVAESARARTFPLSAKLNVQCRSATGESADLRVTGRCPASGTLLMSASEPGTAAAHFGYALIGETTEDKPLTGQYELGAEESLPLGSQVAGPHTIVFFVAEKPVDLAEMRHALSLARPGDLGDMLLKLEQFRTVLRRGHNDARIERLRFLVEAG